MIDPDGGRFSYTFDAKNRLTVLVNPQSKRTSFSYDALDRLRDQRHANGTRTTHVYDNGGRLSVLANAKKNGTGINRYTYSYDAVGRKTRSQEYQGVVTWTYDKAGQLTREYRTGTGAFDVTHTYDPAGNRTQQLDSGTAAIYTHDAANQLLTETIFPSAKTTYTYDPAGNRTKKEAASATSFYAWDENNRLREAEPPAGAVTMTYNADGRRVQKQSPAETRKFVYDFEKVLQESDAGDATTREYTWTEEEYGDLVSECGDGETLYYEYDGVGSTADLVNDFETITDRYRYRAFGLKDHADARGGDLSGQIASGLPLRLGAKSAENRHTFVGKQGYYEDTEIDLYFLRNNYYDPAAGRFVGPDPLSYGVGPNLYPYCGNDPVNKTDASGFGDWDPSDAWSYLSEEDKQRWWTLRDQGWRLVTTQDGQTREDFNTGWNIYTDVYESTWKGWLEKGYDVDWVNDLYGIDYNEKQIWIDAAIDKNAAGYLSTVFDSITNEKPLPQEGGGWWDWIVPEWLKSAAAAALEGVKRGLTFAFNAALAALHIDPKEFWDAVGQITSDVGALVKTLVTKGTELIGNFLGGAKKGFENFVANIKDYLINGLLEWLKLPPALAKFDFAGAGVQEFAGLFFELIGYTWDNLIEMVKEAVGPKNIGIIANLYAKLAEVVDKGLFGWIQEEAAKLKEEAQDFLADLGKMGADILKQAGLEGVKIAGEAIAKNLLPLLFPASAVGKALLAIIDAVRWLWREKDKLLSLFEKVKTLFQKAMKGVSESEIAESVVGFLSGSVAPILSAVASIFGMGSIPERIKKVLEAVQKTAQKPIKTLLNALAKPITAIFDKLRSAIPGGLKDEDMPLVKPAEYGPEGKKQVWVTAQGEKVLTSDNPKEDLEKVLERGDKDKNARALELVKELKAKAKKLFDSLHTKAQNTQGIKNNVENVEKPLKPENLPSELEKGAGAAAGKCTESPDSNKVGEVAYGSTDLSRMVIEERKKQKVFTLRNFVVLEYCDDKGMLQTIVTISRSNLQFDENFGHAEKLALEELETRKVPKSRVTRVYSEFQPCSLPGAYCGTLLRREVSQAKITWSFEYGDKSSRERGRQALRNAIERLQ